MSLELEQPTLLEQFEAVIQSEDRLKIRDFLDDQNISDVAQLVDVLARALERTRLTDNARYYFTPTRLGDYRSSLSALTAASGRRARDQLLHGVRSGSRRRWASASCRGRTRRPGS